MPLQAAALALKQFWLLLERHRPVLDLLGGVLTSDLELVFMDLLCSPAPGHNLACWTQPTSRGFGMFALLLAACAS